MPSFQTKNNKQTCVEEVSKYFDTDHGESGSWNAAPPWLQSWSGAKSVSEGQAGKLANLPRVTRCETPLADMPTATTIGLDARRFWMSIESMVFRDGIPWRRPIIMHSLSRVMPLQYCMWEFRRAHPTLANRKCKCISAGALTGAVHASFQAHDLE